MTHECKCVGTTGNYTNKRQCHWQRSMREFWEKREEKCKHANPVTAPSKQTTKEFPTGSSYKGAYEDMNMRGYGEYTFPNGVVYRGEFDSGMCHGDGELVYNNGPEEFTVIRGLWNKGILKDGKIYFNGILEYNNEDWRYCKMPDRRYGVEFNKELKPAGKSDITAEKPPRKIPPGFIDNGYGYYNPKTKVVYNYHNESEVIKAASKREQLWIEDNCRVEPMKSMGPRVDLYETWLGPDVNPTPLPKLLVGFKPMDTSSVFEKQQEEEMAKQIFYDPTNRDFPRPPRKFQPPRNKDK